jgi:NDP-sugar pyrophosphorylase family protein
MKAVILAGGEGKRLKPLTHNVPKPLLPIGRKPILEIIIEHLRNHGIKDIILTLEYKAELIKAYFHNGSNLGVNIIYYQEGKFTGTAGPVKAVEHLLGEEPFITMNGDLLTDINLTEMYQEHLEKSAELTMATTTYKIQLPYGIIDLEDGNISALREKPELTFLANAGIYVVSPSALDIAPKGEFYNMTDLIQALVDQNRKVELFHIIGEWQDLGTMESYEKAKAEYLDKTESFSFSLTN